MGGLGGHGKAKYITGTRLGTSHGLGWKGVLAERWSHSEGDLGEVQVRHTEVIVMLKGRLHVRRRGDGKLQHCNAVPGTVWHCPNGVREDMIHLPDARLEIAAACTRRTRLPAPSARHRFHRAHLGENLTIDALASNSSVPRRANISVFPASGPQVSERTG